MFFFTIKQNEGLKINKLENWNQVKKFLEEEPMLRKELDDLYQSLEDFSCDFSKEIFDARCNELEDFLELLTQLVALPKVR